MTAMTIRFESIDTVKSFVDDVIQMEGDLDMISGRYRVDAKSIMGILSLDLSQPLRLEMDGGPAEQMKILEKYRIK